MNNIRRHIGKSIITAFAMLFICGCSTKNSNNQKASTYPVYGIGDTAVGGNNYFTLNSYEINPGLFNINFSVELSKYNFKCTHCYAVGPSYSSTVFNLNIDETIAFNRITFDENDEFSYSGDFTFIFLTESHTFKNGDQIVCRLGWNSTEFVFSISGLDE